MDNYGDIPKEFRSKVAELDARLLKLGAIPNDVGASDYEGMNSSAIGKCYNRAWDSEGQTLGFRFRITGADKTAWGNYEEAYSFDLCEFGLERMEQTIAFLERHLIEEVPDG